MVAELRYVILTHREVCAAVARHVSRTMPILAGRVARHIEILPDASAGFARFDPAGSMPVRLDGGFLLSAILIHCRAAGVPIAARAEKRLEPSAEGVALVMTINAWRRVGGDAAAGVVG